MTDTLLERAAWIGMLLAGFIGIVGLMTGPSLFGPFWVPILLGSAMSLAITVMILQPIPRRSKT